MKSRFKDSKRTRYFDPDEIRRLFEAIQKATRRSAFLPAAVVRRLPPRRPGLHEVVRDPSRPHDARSVALVSRRLQERRSARHDGTSGHRSDSWKPVKRLQADSGVLDFANHHIRRTISTYMTSTLDIPTDVVTAILNHRLPGPKANENYVQVLPVRRMRAALDAWGRHLEQVVNDQEPRVLAFPAFPRAIEP